MDGIRIEAAVKGANVTGNTVNGPLTTRKAIRVLGTNNVVLGNTAITPNVAPFSIAVGNEDAHNISVP